MRDLPGLLVIPAPQGSKDLSEAHIADLDVLPLVESLRNTAIPIEHLEHKQEDGRVSELWQKASSVLVAPDPLDLAKQEIRNLGYGGDLGPQVIVYLAATSRVLKMRPGAMPAHLLLLGPSSAGKSYTAKVALRLFSPQANHEIEAGSPRVLLYDDADLKHRDWEMASCATHPSRLWPTPLAD